MTKKPSPAVTAEISTDVFSPEDQAALMGAAAAVAESDDAEDKAVETYARKLGTAPTLDMYTHSQRIFQAGYMQTSPAITPEALSKRTSRFFGRVLNENGITRPKSADPAAEKKAEQREKQKAEILAAYKGKAPKQIKEEIAQAYAKLAAGVPDSAEVKKELKKAETALREMTAAETEAFRKQKAALVSSITEAVKKCTDLAKLTKALEALK